MVVRCLYISKLDLAMHFYARSLILCLWYSLWVNIVRLLQIYEKIQNVRYCRSLMTEVTTIYVQLHYS